MTIFTDLFAVRIEERFEIDDVWVRDQSHDLELTILHIETGRYGKKSVGRRERGRRKMENKYAP
jgi:hypothetical protein